MLKISIDSTKQSNNVVIMASGGLDEITAEVGVVINSFYTRLTQSNPRLGAAFRSRMLAMVADPDTPLWDMHSGDDIGVVIPVKTKED